MSHQILSQEELGALESRYARKLGDDAELMRRAGAAIASHAARHMEEGDHAVIICGPGNNGGDGFAAALELQSRGFEVTVALVGCDKPKSELASRFFDQWIGAGNDVIRDPYLANKAQVVIDALFGVGMKGPLSGEYQDAAMWFNERQAYHIAVDIPSGLDAATGNWIGNIKGVMTDLTVCMLAPKAGCFMNVGADASGEVVTEELDISIPLSTLGVIETDDFRHVLDPRERNSHKGTYGHVVVIGGDEGTVGAAFLAARAALMLGAGRVTLELMCEPAPAFDPMMPELMVSSRPVDLSQASAIVIGCGMGFSEKAKARARQAVETNVPLVIDADALRMMARDQELQDAVLARRAHTVITPHPGEAADLLHRTVREVQSDRVTNCRELAIQTGAITVLKGTGTVVSLRSSRSWINPTGNAMLATAGSGDVLSGMLAAMFAQDYDLVSATLSAVWLHGESAAERYAGMTASDIAPAAAMVLEQMRQSA